MTTEILPAIPENKEIEQGISNVVTTALAIKVTNVESCRMAKEHFAVLNAMEKEIIAWFDPHVKKANELHKSLTSARAAEIAKLTPGKTHLNGEVVRWETEEEARRREEERRLLEEARKREEEERIAAAIEAERAGDKEEAEAILEEKVFVPPPVVEKTIPKVNGTAVRETWKARVDSLSLLVKAVAEGKAPLLCLEANEMFLGQQARAGKGTITYAGVTFYPDKSLGGARK